MISSQTSWHTSCDSCGKKFGLCGYSQEQFMKQLADAKWCVFDKKTICQECMEVFERVNVVHDDFSIFLERNGTEVAP